MTAELGSLSDRMEIAADILIEAALRWKRDKCSATTTRPIEDIKHWRWSAVDLRGTAMSWRIIDEERESVVRGLADEIANGFEVSATARQIAEALVGVYSITPKALPAAGGDS